MKRRTFAIDPRSDSVRVGFRRSFVDLHVAHPSRGFDERRQIKAPGIEHVRRIDFTVTHRQNPRGWIQRREHRAQPVETRIADPIESADEDDVRILDLFDQQVRQLAWLPGFTSVRGQFLRRDHVLERLAVDYRDERIEPREFAEAEAVAIEERERLRDRHRLRDSSRLDQQVIEALLSRERADLIEQIGAQRATDAAVAHLDQLVHAAMQLDVASHIVGVDVHVAHVVDDHGHLQAGAIAQDVIQQRRLPGAEEAGQDRHRNPRRRAGQRGLIRQRIHARVSGARSR
ncbi:hypothetical protein ABID76_006226 [Burkholderia ambifaria]